MTLSDAGHDGFRLVFSKWRNYPDPSWTMPGLGFMIGRSRGRNVNEYTYVYIYIYDSITNGRRVLILFHSIHLVDCPLVVQSKSSRHTESNAMYWCCPGFFRLWKCLLTVCWQFHSDSLEYQCPTCKSYHERLALCASRSARVHCWEPLIKPPPRLRSCRYGCLLCVLAPRCLLFRNARPSCSLSQVLEFIHSKFVSWQSVHKI